MGDTNLWELLEQLNLQDLVAVGGLASKVGDDYKDGDSNGSLYFPTITLPFHPNIEDGKMGRKRIWENVCQKANWQ